MGCPVFVFATAASVERLALERWLVVQKKGAIMRSNAPLHARKKLPAGEGEPVLRWCGVTRSHARHVLRERGVRAPPQDSGGIPGG